MLSTISFLILTKNIFVDLSLRSLAYLGKKEDSLFYRAQREEVPQKLGQVK